MYLTNRELSMSFPCCKHFPFKLFFKADGTGKKKGKKPLFLSFLQRQPKFDPFSEWLKIKTPLQSAFCD